MHPKKVLAKKLFYQKFALVLKNSVFRAKLFSGALFAYGIFTFLESVWKDGFFDTPFDLIKEKSFHLILGSVCTFYELKSPKWKQPLKISENGFYKQVLEFQFHCPSKFLCQTSGRQNHWSLLCIYNLSSFQPPLPPPAPLYPVLFQPLR